MLQEIRDAHWDVIVIGTGIGGGLAARRLTELGLNVLMVEKGRDLGDTDSGLPMNSAHDSDERLAAGAWPKPLIGYLDGRRMELEGLVGAAVGGTSLYYAATLERPEHHDLDDLPGRPHPTGGWPVGFSGFAPHFRRAESYFNIGGETDPLDPAADPLPYPPRDLSAIDQRLAAALRADGLHPYQTHMAARFVPGCENCFGRRCAKRCKMDGRTAGVLPAMESGRAALIDRCTVVSISATDRVSEITCRREGETFTLRASHYILAAGGLGTPALLLRSRSSDWPEGIGNRHDQLGRNLMFHLSEIIAIWPSKGGDQESGENRSISFRDLYFNQGQRFGLVQSMGLTAGYGELLYAMQGRFDQSALRQIGPLRRLLRLPAFATARLMGRARLFVGILEDLPYADNRVLRQEDPDQLEFTYAIADELKSRRQAFRQAMRGAFRANRNMFMGSAPQLNFAHPCGTARFGTDPRTSVLDPDCRVHGLANLFVADASFMPTSNGVNPSLTIGANALRVAEVIAARHHSSQKVA